MKNKKNNELAVCGFATVKKLEKLKQNLSVLQHVFNGAVNTDGFDFKMESINLFIDIKKQS